MRSVFWTLIIGTMSMYGCGMAGELPKGYAVECYGGEGRENIRKSIAFAPGAQLEVKVYAPEASWPQLSRHLSAFASQNDLHFFDTTLRLEHVHALGLRVCSSKDIDINAIKQIWKEGPAANRNLKPDWVTVTLRGYKPGAPRKSTGESLARSFSIWQGEVEITWNDE